MDIKKEMVELKDITGLKNTCLMEAWTRLSVACFYWNSHHSSSRSCKFCLKLILLSIFSESQLAWCSIFRIIDGIAQGALRETPFAVCQGHTVKPLKPTANPLPCAAHGKAHTATRDRQSRPLPCVIYRAHGKGFAVCNYRPTAKKSRHPGTMTWPGLCRVPIDVAHGKVQMFAVCLGFGTR